MTKGVFDSIRVKLTDINFEEGQRRPCFLRVLCKNMLSECPIEMNGWYTIEGPFEFSNNEILTLACISIWGQQVAGLREAKIEAVELIDRRENWGADLSWNSTTNRSALLALHSLDPLGITVKKDDHYIKFIRSHKLESLKTFLESSVFRESVVAGMIVPATILETGQRSFGQCLVTNSAWGPSYSLTFTQLKNFAKQVLLLMKKLISDKDGAYCLIDAHLGNFTQTTGGTFSLLDYGSISSFEPHVAFGGIENFTRMILAPLAICARNDSSTFRSIHLSVNGNGIEIEGEVISRESSLQKVAECLNIPVSKCETVSEFLVLFNHLDQWIDSQTRSTRTDFWSNYQVDAFQIDEISQSMQWIVNPNNEVCSLSVREQTVIELLSALNYRSLIDLGCNTGKFSIYAALLGYQVSAIDSNEQVIDALFEFVSSEGLPISVFHGSVFDEDFTEACEADVVLALALTHHLMLGDYSPALQPPKSMDDVCGLISGLAKRAALVEFMPLGVGSAVNGFIP
jgi:Tellurite resistance protein TehB